jgi:protein-tyrosine phosphatase
MPRAVKSEPFRVLFVCTGNICRSPMAQAMLLHRLRARLGVEAVDRTFDVTSAGTGAVVGHPIDELAVDAMAALGITPDPFQASDVDVDMLEATDLVLTGTREHRAAIASLGPRVVPRVFTVREFARYIDAVDMAEVVSGGAAPAARLASLVEQAAALRGLVRPVAPKDDDIADPYRQSAAAFQRAATEIDQATSVIAERMAACLAPGLAPGCSPWR